MTELIKSLSIENMVNQRRAVANLLKEAHTLLTQAESIAKQAHLGSIRHIFDERRYGGFNFLEESGADKASHALDRDGWVYLMNESGMRSLMDAKARKEWDSTVYEGKYPELTKENVTATFAALHNSRDDLFDRGVIECFKSLSWNYKTNSPFKFGKKVIVECITTSSAGRVNHWANMRVTDRLDDLVRVFTVLDKKPEPDHRNGMYSVVSSLANSNQKIWEGDYFHLKWFKNGNGHITFKRPDLVDHMNRILAKHYPDALPAQN